MMKAMNEDDSKKALSEDELDTVAGGARRAAGVCSACGSPVTIEGVTLPWYGKCPHCGQAAFINPTNYTFF